jgi:putative transposase
MLSTNHSVEELYRGQLIADSSRAVDQGNDQITGLSAVDRICWIDLDVGVIGLIEVTSKNAKPRIETTSVIERGLNDGTIRLLECDSWLASPLSAFYEGQQYFDLAKKEKGRIKKRMKIIEPLVKDHERELFVPKTRNALFQELEEKGIASRPTTRAWIRMYYQGGMTANALITDYGNCGGKGKRREAGSVKRGRPVLRENKGGPSDGGNVSLLEAELLYKGYKKFYLKEESNGVADAYRLTLGRYFAVDYEFVHGALQPILPEVYPTRGQFYYYGTSDPCQRQALASRVKTKDRNLNIREVMGSAREGISGPGEQYQVDWTGALVHVVSKKNRSIRIGKGILYAISDTYSQRVVAFCLVLENASYIVLATLLERAFTNMAEFCRSRGFDISDDEWPSGIICESLLADRGSPEMGYSLEFAAAGLSFEISTTGSGRADWKPYIERIFGGVKQETENIPGATSGPKKRGTSYEPDEACLNLDEHELILMRHFFDFNSKYEVKNHPDAIHLLAQGLAPTPDNLWAWGRKHRSGIGRRFDPEYVRLTLLPRTTVSATPEGLSFLKLAYQSQLLLDQGEFLRLKGHKRSRFLICYDPRDLSRIWLIDEKGSLVETCPLTNKYSHLLGISLWELKSLRAAEAPYKKSLNKQGIESFVGRQNYIKQLIDNARAEQAFLGASSATYDDNERRREQAERRRENAWTKSIGTSEAFNVPEPKAIDPNTEGSGLHIANNEGSAVGGEENRDAATILKPDYEDLLIEKEGDW